MKLKPMKKVTITDTMTNEELESALDHNDAIDAILHDSLIQALGGWEANPDCRPLRGLDEIPLDYDPEEAVATALATFREKVTYNTRF